ncbi:hypothetical protein [Clostridium vincentii]|uniref:Uncharacterized protein n=1 Tax=Clostridium vincentii TaxID=52704 RepID=A0A2T0BKW4_9CLOT|nr:hypothetical protein [Clostridium vincentii]PRR84526.1 hypothetical protein CLVI_00490 [Clostridium vincentii]
MINKLIIDALKPLNIPVAFQRYSGKAQIYITFYEYLATGEEYEDDEEALTAHYIQVDLWSKVDYIDVVKTIKELLLNAGFKRLNEIDLYEEDTKIYHKGLKFYYLEECDING